MNVDTSTHSALITCPWSESQLMRTVPLMFNRLAVGRAPHQTRAQCLICVCFLFLTICWSQEAFEHFSIDSSSADNARSVWAQEVWRVNTPSKTAVFYFHPQVCVWTESADVFVSSFRSCQAEKNPEPWNTCFQSIQAYNEIFLITQNVMLQV